MTMPDLGASERVCAEGEVCSWCGVRDSNVAYGIHPSYLGPRGCVPALKAEVARLREALFNGAERGVIGKVAARMGWIDMATAEELIVFLEEWRAISRESTEAAIAEAEARGRREMREEMEAPMGRLKTLVRALDKFSQSAFSAEAHAIWCEIDAIRALPDRREP